MVEPVYHKEKIINIGNRLREIRKSVNKKSQMSLRDVLVLAHMQIRLNRFSLLCCKYNFMNF